MKRIRVGIVGCGEVVQIIHLPSLYQLPDQFEVTALCDVSAKVVGAVGDHWGVTKRFLDYRELLEQSDVDAVLVTNPHGYHAQVTLAALAAGKHVLVEKPMCITLREADEIIAAQKRTGLTVQVGYMRRFAPAFVQACRLARESGDIRLARVHDFIGQNGLIINQTSRVIRGDDVPADTIAEGRELQGRLLTEALGEAPRELHSAYLMLLGLSTHDISAMRELLGTPAGVLYAAQRSGGRVLSAAFDYGSFVCQFETGGDQIPRYDTYLEVYTAERVLRVDYDTPYVRNLPIRLATTEPSGQGGIVQRSEMPSWGDPFVVEWQDFHANIAAGTEPKTAPTDFRKDLELFNEMIRLMR